MLAAKNKASLESFSQNHCKIIYLSDIKELHLRASTYISGGKKNIDIHLPPLHIFLVDFK